MYTNIRNYVCINYLGSELKNISKLGIGSDGHFQHVNKSYDKILGIGISDLLMNLMYFHGIFEEQRLCCHTKIP